MTRGASMAGLTTIAQSLDPLPYLACQPPETEQKGQINPNCHIKLLFSFHDAFKL